MLWIGPILVMAEIFSRLALMPRSETMKPSSMPLGTPKHTLFGIEFDAICPEFRKGLFKVGDKVVSSLGFDYDVVDIGLNGSPDEVSEAIKHTTLVRCPCIL